MAMKLRTRTVCATRSSRQMASSQAIATTSMTMTGHLPLLMSSGMLGTAATNPSATTIGRMVVKTLMRHCAMSSGGIGMKHPVRHAARNFSGAY